MLDLAVEGGIEEPLRLAATIKLTPGVCEHGLFLGLASGAIIAGAAGVRTLGAIE